ncbi:MAG: hypothetical protein M0Z32_00415 [Actinomycetota bacterium]|jgi:hypothetical protein|nr:hypothetical protein [Actinomycetota bacterium]MCL6092810.1 hypothetical protein [Actinomycetota bacterium]MDA8166212.1 hypothetical protein [Actinomycetota bacterium]
MVSNFNEAANQIKRSSFQFSGLETELKNRALAQIAQDLMDYKDEILKANRADLRRSEQEDLSKPLLYSRRQDGVVSFGIPAARFGNTGKKWPVWTETAGRLAPKQVAGMGRNTHLHAEVLAHSGKVISFNRKDVESAGKRNRE